MSRDILITPHRGSTGPNQYPEIAFNGLSQSTIKLLVDDDGSVVYVGTYGSLFNITDNKDGLLHSVNDISGLPILSVYSTDYVQMGKFNKNTLIVNSDKVGVGLTGPTNLFHIYSTQSGAFRLQDGTQGLNKVLVSDSTGVASWVTQSVAGGGLTGSGTINYVPRWTSTSVLSGTSSIYDDGTNVGIGITGSNSKVSIKGNTNLISNTTLNIINASSSNLLQLNDDGLSTLGFTGGNSRTQVNLGNSQYFRINSNDYARFALSDNNIDWFRITPTAFDEAVLSSNGILDIVAGGASTLYTRWSEGAGGVGFNTQNPLARVHIVGRTNDNTSIAFKVQNSSLENLLDVRNDGFFDINVDDNYARVLSVNSPISSPSFMVYGSTGESFKVEGYYGRVYMGGSSTTFGNSATLNIGGYGLGKYINFGLDGRQGSFTDADSSGIIFTGKQHLLSTIEFRLVSDEGLLTGINNTTAYFRRNVDIGGVGSGDGVSRLYILGETSLSTKNALIIYNSLGTNMFQVRNDGNIYALPTYGTSSNSGTYNFLGIDSTGKLFNTGVTQSGGTSGWSLTGNTGLSSSINFLGTTDNTDLVFKSNNLERYRLFSNGQLSIGTTSNVARLGVFATGSGEIGIFLNTTSTQDSKLHLGTNNATSARFRLYVEDSTQTSNFYTVNNDTVFWNGNGLSQVKTLTLYTNTSAKFESYLYVGSNITIDGLDGTVYPININSSRMDLTRFRFANGGNTQTDIQIGNNNGANSLYIGVNTSANSFIDNRTGNLLFQNTGVTQMTFDSSGNLGIRVNTPTAKLHVSGIDLLSTNYALKVDDGSSNQLLHIKNNGAILTLPTYVTQSNSGTFNLLGIDNTGKLFNTNIVPNTSLKLSYIEVSSTYSILSSDYTINTDGTFSVYLPSSVGLTGSIYNIKNSGLGTVAITTTASQTIDGTFSVPIYMQYDSYRLQSTGSNWIII